MLGKKMETALNDQVNAELYSSYLYLSMEAYFQSLSLKGFANWMRCQAQEELFHAMKMYDHIIERGGKVRLTSIEGPQIEWKSPLAVFEATLTHEKKVTGLIDNLVDIAIEERDHASNTFLQWYVGEQVEEEASADEVIQQLKLMSDTSNGLFLMDRELAARVFTMPAETEK
ncbi:ferritin [Candidatus Latescibacterota bacterium]